MDTETTNNEGDTHLIDVDGFLEVEKKKRQIESVGERDMCQ